MKPVLDARHIIVHKDPNAYTAHPAIIATAKGEWLIICNESIRRTHRLHPPQDPRFYNLLIRSSDQGQTWETPRVTPGFEWHGVECSALTELQDGKLLMNQWQFKWYPLETARKLMAEMDVRLPPWSLDSQAELSKHQAEHQEPADQIMARYPWGRTNGGAYIHISRDSGRTWDETIQIDVAPYPGGYAKGGGLQLPSGEVLLPLTVIPGWDVIYTVRSRDSGNTWDRAEEAVRQTGVRFSEAHTIVLPSGRLLMMLRAHPSGRLHRCYSDDDGHTWYGLSGIPVWGYPPHMLVLPDGRILCVFGHRREPYSIQAILSSDEGETWDIENILLVRGDLGNDDHGYPTSVLAQDGRIFTTYYCQDSDGVTCIQGTYYRV